MVNDGRIVRIHSSDVQMFKQCRQKWEWAGSFHRNLAPQRPYAPFLAGRAAHHALESVREEDFDSAAVVAEYFNVERTRMSGVGVLLEEEETMLQEQQELITGMIAHYREWRKQDRGPFRDENLVTAVTRDGELGIELKFDVPLLDPYGEPHPWVHLGGRIDRAVRRKDDGSLWLVEYKTCRSIPERERTIPFDEQPELYLIAAEAVFGERPKGVIYDLLRKKLPAEPRVLQNGTLSRSMSQDMTFASYVASIRRHHGEEATPDFIKFHYGEVLQALLLSASPKNEFFKRVIINKTDYMLDEARRMLYLVAMEMVDPSTPIYTTGGNHCGYCVFRTPCMVKRQGGNYDLILSTDFTARDDHSDGVEAVEA